MQPDRPRALLLGGTGRYPFNGHLRLAVGQGEAMLHVASSIAPGADPAVAYGAAQAVHAALCRIQGRNRHDLLRAAWEALREIAPVDLGPAAGADVALLLFAVDREGTAVAATGLSAVYTFRNRVFDELVPADHPLLAAQGVPAVNPGFLTPTEPPVLLIGAPRSGSRDLPSGADWRASCGDRDD
jgi:hypothetical protein